MIAYDGTVKSIKATFYVVRHEETEGEYVVLLAQDPGGPPAIRFVGKSVTTFELAPIGSVYILVSADVLKLDGIWTKGIP